ncbi:MAG: TrkH family potassium uptake protein, partial [Caldisericaceae bacterium]
GLSYMTIATFFLIFSGRRVTLKDRFILKEGLNAYKLSGIVSFAKSIFFVVATFEGLGAFALTLRFLRQTDFIDALWKGIFHSVSAFCNAGFDLMGGFQSFTPYVNDLTVNLTVMLLIVIGGIGFFVMYELINKFIAYFKNDETKKLSLHTKIVLRVTAILIIVGAILILVFEWTNPKSIGSLPLRGKILSAFFQSVTPRTAGFNTLNIADLRQTTLVELIFLMFVGGSPGGTAGGVKTTTFVVFLFLIFSAYSERTPVVISGRTIRLEILRKAVFIISIAFTIIFVSTILILVAQGSQFSFLQVLFEVTSAFGTVGLTTGITPNLSDFSRIVIVTTMFLGRVGPLSFVLSLASKKKKVRPEYPEEDLAIG